jgi:hypothetical protein
LSQQPVLASHFHSIFCFVEFLCFVRSIVAGYLFFVISCNPSFVAAVFLFLGCSLFPTTPKRAPSCSRITPPPSQLNFLTAYPSRCDAHDPRSPLKKEKKDLQRTLQAVPPSRAGQFPVAARSCLLLLVCLASNKKRESQKEKKES